jgi:hypothetical protein
VQIGAEPFREASVGGVAEEQVTEAEHRLIHEVRSFGQNEQPVLKGGES